MSVCSRAHLIDVCCTGEAEGSRKRGRKRCRLWSLLAASQKMSGGLQNGWRRILFALSAARAFRVQTFKRTVISVQLRPWISHSGQICLFAQSASCFATCQGNVRGKAANWSDILGRASLGERSKSGRMEDVRVCCSASSSSSFWWEGLGVERVAPCCRRHLWATFQNSACVALVADS